MTSFASTPSDAGSPSPSPSLNPRKRPRTDASSEERKEARAHRNRIAAQNSRDRRKAQFAYLERRVAELEEENRALRAARGIPLLPVNASPAERENEELRERIKTLERGWDAVLKALAAHGLPLALPTPSTPPPPAFPISPAPSHSSLDTATPEPTETATHDPAAGGLAPLSLNLNLDLDLLFPRAPNAPPTASANTHTPPTTNEPDDATMETLFMEILASPLSAPATPSPAAATAPRSAAQTAGSVQAPAEAGASAQEVASSVPGLGLELGMGIGDLGIGSSTSVGGNGDTGAGESAPTVDLGLMTTDVVDEHAWDSGLEMQRILASLGVVGEELEREHEQGDEHEQQGPTELEIELGWTTFGGATGVGVF